MNTLFPTHIIYFTIPALDDGEATQFTAPLAALDARSLINALTMYEAQVAGLPSGESAGFEMVAFAKDGECDATFIIRTCGLGPTADKNVLGHGHVSELTSGFIF
jgi:hypothetical protein